MHSFLQWDQGATPTKQTQYLMASDKYQVPQLTQKAVETRDLPGSSQPIQDKLSNWI